MSCPKCSVASLFFFLRPWFEVTRAAVEGGGHRDERARLAGSGLPVNTIVGRRALETMPEIAVFLSKTLPSSTGAEYTSGVLLC